MVGGVVPEPAGSLRSHTPLALSDLQIRKAEQADNPHQMGGGGLGLFVQINPDDSQLWRMKDRFLGKEKLLALGAYPAVLLSDARRNRGRAGEQIANDIDPSVDEQLDGIEAEARAGISPVSIRY